MRASFRSGALPDFIDALRKYIKPGFEYFGQIYQLRTMGQNAYYHSVVVPLFCQVTGYRRKEGHEKLMKMCLYDYGTRKITSTTELTTVEFQEYIEDCRLLLYHEFKIVAPLPGDTEPELLSELANTFIY